MQEISPSPSAAPHPLVETASSGSSDEAGEPPWLLAGDVLAGRYRVFDLVGEGKHGTVYYAETLHTRHPVAIKCLEPGQGRREAGLLSELAHPLLPTFHEFFSEEISSCLVMEWIEGKPLWRWSADARGPRKELPLAEVFQIGLQLGDIFSYLHRAVPPLWFQDLHEGNVMRTADGQIKLIDFGRARRLSPGEEAKRHFDIFDIRHLLFRLLPPALPDELKWRVRGVHPSLQPEDASDLRAALEALMQELGLAAP